MQITTLRQQILNFAHVLQTSLFPVLAEETGSLSPKAQLLVQVLAMTPFGPWIGGRQSLGRPCETAAPWQPPSLPRRFTISP